MGGGTDARVGIVKNIMSQRRHGQEEGGETATSQGLTLVKPRLEDKIHFPAGQGAPRWEIRVERLSRRQAMSMSLTPGPLSSGSASWGQGGQRACLWILLGNGHSWPQPTLSVLPWPEGPGEEADTKQLGKA